MTKIIMPTYLNDSSLPSVVEQFQSFTKTDLLQFDFYQVAFVTPSGLAGVTALMRLALHNGLAKEYQIILCGASDVHAYMNRMDFYQHFGIVLQSTLRKPRNTDLLEIKGLTSIGDSATVTTLLMGILEKHVGDQGGIHDGMEFALPEVIDNIFDHSGSPIGGIICAQTYPRANRLEVAIVDTGKGIFASIKENGQYADLRSHGEAILEAVKRNSTSKPNGGHSGIGLFLTERCLARNKGKLVIHSGDTIVTFVDERTKPRSGLPYWPGTRIMMSWNLKNTFSFVDMLNEYYPPDEDGNILPF